MSDEFINFYLRDKEEELKSRWKIVSFLEEEVGENIHSYNKDSNQTSSEKSGEEENYYSISRLKEVLKKKDVRED